MNQFKRCTCILEEDIAKLLRTQNMHLRGSIRLRRQVAITRSALNKSNKLEEKHIEIVRGVGFFKIIRSAYRVLKAKRVQSIALT